MKKQIFLAFAFAAALYSCQPAETANQETSEISQELIDSLANAGNANTFGIEVTETNALEMPALLTKMSETDSVADLTIKGKVKEVCQAKGCWMTIEQPDGAEMHVTFKDYALFMPKDLAGKEVVLHGVAQKKIVPVDELKHYAEDAGKPTEEIAAITEPQNKLRFEADGVLVK